MRLLFLVLLSYGVSSENEDKHCRRAYPPFIFWSDKMIYGVFGLPGSGKSYYVVNEFIVKRISKGTVISNIALADDIAIPDNYVYLTKYDMDNLHANIQKIMEDTTKSHDDKKVLLSYLFGLYGDGDITLIVDECHLYGYRGRSSSISYIDDFLSIHRHIFEDRKLDIVLITQVPSRLNTEIANQVEVAVKAIPASQRVVTSLLEYSVYGSVDALRKNDKTMRMKRQIIKGNPKIFELYQSGFVQKGSNDFRKKMIGMVAMVLLAFAFMVKQFMGLVSGEALPSSDKKIVSDDTNKKIKSLRPASDLNNSAYLKNYRIVCRVIVPGVDYEKLPDLLWVELKGKRPYKYCYRSYYRV